MADAAPAPEQVRFPVVVNVNGVRVEVVLLLKSRTVASVASTKTVIAPQPPLTHS